MHHTPPLFLLKLSMDTESIIPAERQSQYVSFAFKFSTIVAQFQHICQFGFKPGLCVWWTYFFPVSTDASIYDKWEVQCVSRACYQLVG